MIRLNKYLSLCGVTSRRGAEQLIAKGKVTVNDTTIDKVGVVIDETKDVVKVDGVEASPAKKRLYIIFNKPRQVLTTLHDPFGRRTVANYTRALGARVYPVGRLDFDTDGVLLMTNDGELAYRLAHPRYQIPKVYHAEVEGPATPDIINRVAKGIKLQDGHLAKAEMEILRASYRTSKVIITLTEGHKREVKQILKAVGLPVRALRRVSFAGLMVNDMKPGRWRYLSRDEVNTLRQMVALPVETQSSES